MKRKSKKRLRLEGIARRLGVPMEWHGRRRGLSFGVNGQSIHLSLGPSWMIGNGHPTGGWQSCRNLDAVALHLLKLDDTHEVSRLSLLGCPLR